MSNNGDGPPSDTSSSVKNTSPSSEDSVKTESSSQTCKSDVDECKTDASSQTSKSSLTDAEVGKADVEEPMDVAEGVSDKSSKVASPVEASSVSEGSGTAEMRSASPTVPQASPTVPQASPTVPQASPESETSSNASRTSTTASSSDVKSQGSSTRSVKRPDIFLSDDESRPPGKIPRSELDQFLLDRRSHIRKCKDLDDALKETLTQFDDALKKVGGQCQQLNELSAEVCNTPEEYAVSNHKLKYQIAVTSTTCDRIYSLITTFRSDFLRLADYLPSANKKFDDNLNDLVEVFITMSLEVDVA